MNTRLREAPFLAGQYSIADIATYPWVKIHEWSGVSIDGLQYLNSWMQRVGQRPAVQTGMSKPPRAESTAAVNAAKGMLGK